MNNALTTMATTLTASALLVASAGVAWFGAEHATGVVATVAFTSLNMAALYILVSKLTKEAADGQVGVGAGFLVIKPLLAVGGFHWLSQWAGLEVVGTVFAFQTMVIALAAVSMRSRLAPITGQTAGQES